MTDSIVVEIRFRLPGREDPGYLLRMRRALVFREAMQAAHQGGTALRSDTVDELVGFLADFVVQPIEREERVAALWQASEAQFMELLEALSGGGSALGNPTMGSAGGERDELRLYHKGVPARLPEWGMALAAAGGDPLRAKEIYEGLDQVWFERWVAWEAEKARARE